jgi:hypothetical protein
MSDDLKAIANMPLTAKIEPFDSFWEGPANVEKGYYTFGLFYRHNYLSFLPSDRSARILAISCGPGYLVDLLTKEGFTNVLGIDSFPEKLEHARRRNLNCVAAEAFPSSTAHRARSTPSSASRAQPPDQGRDPQVPPAAHSLKANVP